MLRYRVFDTVSREYLLTYESSVMARRFTDEWNHHMNAPRFVVITVRGQS